MGMSTDLREDTGGANTFISVILVAVVLVLAGTVWMFLLDDSTPTDAPSAVFDAELDEERLVLKHTNGDTISPGGTDYIGIAGDESIVKY